MENFKNKPNLHFFNPELAECYGVPEAIMLNHLVYWISTNAMKGSNYYDGRYWTFNSIHNFTAYFPYWSENQISRVLKSLTDKKVLITGVYNKHSYDRTKWYAFHDEKHFLTKYNPFDNFKECKRKF